MVQFLPYLPFLAQKKVQILPYSLHILPYLGTNQGKYCPT